MHKYEVTSSNDKWTAFVDHKELEHQVLGGNWRYHLMIWHGDIAIRDITWFPKTQPDFIELDYWIRKEITDKVVGWDGDPVRWDEMYDELVIREA